jgi:hypothetical protein
MQDFGCFDIEEPSVLQQSYEDDLAGVDAFVAWAKGPENQEIRRIALEGVEGAKDDYLAGRILSSGLHMPVTYATFSSEEETWRW